MSNKETQVFVIVPAKNHGVSAQQPHVTESLEGAAQHAAVSYDLPVSARDADNWDSYAGPASSPSHWDFTRPHTNETYHIHKLNVKEVRANE